MRRQACLFVDHFYGSVVLDKLTNLSQREYEAAKEEEKQLQRAISAKLKVRTFIHDRLSHLLRTISRLLLNETRLCGDSCLKTKT